MESAYFLLHLAERAKESDSWPDVPQTKDKPITAVLTDAPAAATTVLSVSVRLSACACACLLQYSCAKKERVKQWTAY